MICYECGLEATEKHHVIPKVNGGNKTIPLCSSCHNKVHGIGGERRDKHKENIMKGIDKHRLNKLWLTYELLHQCDGCIETAKYYNKELNKDRNPDDTCFISQSSFDTCVKRLVQNDAEYWFDFFYKNGFFERQFKTRFNFY